MPAPATVIIGNILQHKMTVPLCSEPVQAAGYGGWMTAELMPGPGQDHQLRAINGSLIEPVGVATGNQFIFFAMYN